MGELLIVIGLGAGLVVGITVTVLKIKAMRKYLKKDKQDKIFYKNCPFSILFYIYYSVLLIFYKKYSHAFLPTICSPYFKFTVIHRLYFYLITKCKVRIRFNKSKESLFIICYFHSNCFSAKNSDNLLNATTLNKPF